MVPVQWLASGGAYWIVGLGWAFSIGFFVWLGRRLGQASGSTADGCLLQATSVVMALVGGSLGLYLFAFPDFLFTSIAGSLLFPALSTYVWHRGPRRPR